MDKSQLCVPLPAPLSIPAASAWPPQPPFWWFCALQVPPHCPEPSSVSHQQFQPLHRMQQTNVALLGRETVGKKVRLATPSLHPQIPTPSDLTIPLSTPLVQEPTGFSLNNPMYVRSPCDPDRDQRYLTTYNQG